MTSSPLGAGGDTPKNDTLIIDDGGGEGPTMRYTGGGLILLESKAKIEKKSVSGGGAYK